MRESTANEDVLVSWKFWPSSCVTSSSLDVGLVCLGLYISFCGPFPSCYDYSHMFCLCSASLPCVFKSLCFLLSLSVHCVFSLFWALHCLLKLTFRSKSDFFWLPASLFLVAGLSAIAEQNWREKRAVETTIVQIRLNNHIKNYHTFGILGLCPHWELWIIWLSIIRLFIVIILVRGPKPL